MSMTELIHAAAHGALDDVRRLVEAGAEVDARSEHGGTALHAAALGGHSEIAQLLLARGADVNAENHQGMTPFFAALSDQNGGPHGDLAKWLVDAGADPDLPLRNGATPLVMFTMHGKTNAAKLCLDCGADPQKSTPLGPPIVAASFAGQLALLDALIEAGVELEARDPGGLTAMDAAKRRGFSEIVDRLRAAGATK